MPIRPLNLDDDAEILRIWDIRAADRRTVEPGYSPGPRATLLGIVRDGFQRDAARHLVAEEDGVVVGVAQVTEPRRDPERAYVGVSVDPDHRRRGIGSALLGALEALTDRPLLEGIFTAEAGGQPAGAAFAEHHGYREHTRSVERYLPWPPPPQAVAERETPGYTVATFTGALPETLVPAYCEFAGRVWSDAPNGDAPLPETETDPNLYRDRMERLAAQGLVRIFAVATCDADGSVAAISDLGFHPTEGFAGTGFTRVAPEHRRRGLALATKAAAYRELLASGAPVRQVTTSNDQANAGMIAVNERLGLLVAREHAEVLRRR